MRSIVLDRPGALRVGSQAHPGEPASGMALVQVRRVGICGTDLHAFRGRQPFFSYPRILGHELAVEVVAVGPDIKIDGVEPGLICAVEPYLNCGVCPSCQRAKTNCCEQLQVLGVHRDGGMREYIHVPAGKLHAAPGVAVEQLALVEMLCIGAHAVRRAQLELGEHVLVVGCGPIGLSTALFARLAGANVTVMETSEARAAFCRATLDIEQAVIAGEDPVASLLEQREELPTTVFDATGNVRSMEQAFTYVANGGTLVFVGLVQDNVTFFDPEFHRRELTLLSSRNATAQDFQYVINNMVQGKIDVSAWITHYSTPETIVTDFPGWLKPESGVVKAMLAF